jgi:putative transposase
LMSASDRFQHPTTRVHEMWQTDFTYFRIIGWGWYDAQTTRPTGAPVGDVEVA